MCVWPGAESACVFAQVFLHMPPGARGRPSVDGCGQRSRPASQPCFLHWLALWWRHISQGWSCLQPRARSSLLPSSRVNLCLLFSCSPALTVVFSGPICPPLHVDCSPVADCSCRSPWSRMWPPRNRTARRQKLPVESTWASFFNRVSLFHQLQLV